MKLYSVTVLSVEDSLPTTFTPLFTSMAGAKLYAETDRAGVLKNTDRDVTVPDWLPYKGEQANPRCSLVDTPDEPEWEWYVNEHDAP